MTFLSPIPGAEDSASGVRGAAGAGSGFLSVIVQPILL